MIETSECLNLCAAYIRPRSKCVFEALIVPSIVMLCSGWTPSLRLKRCFLALKCALAVCLCLVYTRCVSFLRWLWGPAAFLGVSVLSCNLSPESACVLTTLLWWVNEIKETIWSRTIAYRKRSSAAPPTGLVSMLWRAVWWARYRSCRRSTWLWKRGCFLTGSSGPNCGETTVGTGVWESEKTKGLNTDLAGHRWVGWTRQRSRRRKEKSQKHVY